MTNNTHFPIPEHFEFGYAETLEYYAKMFARAAEKGEEDVRRLKRDLGSTDLFFLLGYILNRKEIISKPWLFRRCREWQRNPNGHLDLWAREHYKSTVITFAGTIFEIINDPEVTIGIFSHTKSIARGFVRQIKEELEQNETLKKLWPDIFYEEPARESNRWSIDGGIIVKRNSNPKEATVEGHGLVDGQPTGLHFKGRVYDDVVTLESVSTPEQIEKTTYAWQMSDNLGSEGGWERYIGTRYHLFDTYSVMIDRKAVIPRVHPATINGHEDGRPVLMTRETLRKKRVTQGPYVFASQMLLNPTADKAMGFNTQWLVYSDVDYDAAMRQLWRFILVDPAGSKQRKNNDFTTFLVIGHGADKKFRVLDIVRDRLNLTGRTEKLFELHEKWKPHLVAYEEYGMQADIEHIEYVMDEKLYEFEITSLGGSMKKELRILRLVPYFENGFKEGDDEGKSRIILPTSRNYIDYQQMNRDLVKDFVEQEYEAFPVLNHDDMLDCMARLCDLEEKGLIELPKIEPPKRKGITFHEGFGKIGNTGDRSWVTA